jgi:hypothetical protein
VVGSLDGDGLASDLARHLAGTTHAIQHVPFADRVALLQAGQSSSALVLSPPPRESDTEVGEDIDALVAILPCPIYVVRPIGVTRRAAEPV